ncbi:BON domain-containing protein [Shinella sp. BYT-45]|uniref:BON domain-containing protein n=1 Tax=Shinella sp. BYT-45 TaxID=3377377 RepID=UPI0039804FA7
MPENPSLFQQLPWRKDTRNEAGNRPDLDFGSSASPAARHRGKGPKGYERPDARIHEEICERLAEDGDIDASRIEVSVSGGEVRLSGFVDTPREKHLAERRAEAVLAVRHVRNDIRIMVPGEPIATETGH